MGMKLKRKSLISIVLIMLFIITLLPLNAFAEDYDFVSSKPASVKFKAIAAGAAFTAGLKDDGTVIVWGENTYGQCNVPSGLSGVIKIACGRSHVVVLKDDGTVVAWGDNWEGQCDLPNDLKGVKDIYVGMDYTVILKEDGLFVYGGLKKRLESRNLLEKLVGVKEIAVSLYGAVALKEDGAVETLYSESPEYNVPLGLKGVKSVKAGYDFTIALKEDGTVVSWGSNNPGKNVPPGLNNVVEIGAGLDHAVALRQDGTVVTWGVEYDKGNVVVENLNSIRGIAVGFRHVVTLKEDGSLVTWGDNNWGQESILPTQLTNIKTISGGFLIKDDGTILHLGTGNTFGLRGIKAASMYQNDIFVLKETGEVIRIRYIDRILYKVIETGITHVKELSGNLMLKEDGTVLQWEPYSEKITNIKVSNVKAIAAGGEYSAALKEDGTVVEWRKDGTIVNLAPEGLIGVKAIAAAYSHTLALLEDKTVVTWGTTLYPELLKVPEGLTGVKAISADETYSIALKEDGTVVLWGIDRRRLPNYQLVPVPNGLSNVKAIWSYGLNTWAIKNDGSLIRWGWYFIQNYASVPSICYKITGYIKPDIQSSDNTNQAGEGFNIEMPDTVISTTTDSNGYFELNVPVYQSVYGIRISKPNYQTMEIKNVSISNQCTIGTSSKPIEMWAGDIGDETTQDGAINMADVLQVAKVFNSISSDPEYNSALDFNKDNVVNMVDIMIISKHFNKTTKDYPRAVITEN